MGISRKHSRAVLCLVEYQDYNGSRGTRPVMTRAFRLPKLLSCILRTRKNNRRTKCGNESLGLEASTGALSTFLDIADTNETQELELCPVTDYYPGSEEVDPL